MKSAHDHPHPQRERLVQYGALLLTGLMLLAALLQLALALLGAPGGLFLITALLTLLLALIIIRLTVATPAVTVSEAGIEIRPLVWKSQFVAWEAVRAIKDYTLLPDVGAETGRRAVVGRRKYRAAEGKMLVIPALPLRYRITGVLAGEGFVPVIAVTNRTHTEYDKLVKKMLIYYEDAMQVERAN